MSTVEIFTEVAEARVVDLVQRSERHNATARSLRFEFARLGLDVEPAAATAIDQLVRAGHELASVAHLISEVAHSALAADRFGSCTGTSSAYGDRGETFTCVERPRWRLDARQPGIALISQALADTADDGIIGDDEFEIVHVGGNRYVVVLAGVTDLGRPRLGYDDRSHTVRDLDQGALKSATGPDVDDNVYALYVREAIRRHVPDGAQLVIVGHSYGADTGLDLAADPTFNGQQYTVTHVAAFGYHVKHLIGAVPQRTEVLAVNNSTDAVVLAESVADGPHLVATGQVELARSLLGGRSSDARSAIDDITAGLKEMAHDAVALPTAPVSIARRTPTVSSDGSHHIVSFPGGIGRDAGHGQTRYIDFVNTGEFAAVTEFADSLADHGYAPVDTAIETIAVDVSRLP